MRRQQEALGGGLSCETLLVRLLVRRCWMKGKVGACCGGVRVGGSQVGSDAYFCEDTEETAAGGPWVKRPRGPKLQLQCARVSCLPWRSHWVHVCSLLLALAVT